MQQLHEETPNVLPVTTHARVTPEELVRAITEIESRKVNGCCQPENTVSVEAVVEELQLNMSASELLEEIQTQRQNGNKKKLASNRHSGSFSMKLAFALSLCIIGALSWYSFTLHRALTGNLTGKTQPVSMRKVQPSEFTRAFSGYEPLAEAQEGYPIAVDVYAMRRLARGVSPDQVQVGVNVGREKTDWQLQKFDGRFLVSAWATATDATAAVEGKPSHVFSSEYPGSKNVDIPLGAFEGAKIDVIGGRGRALINIPR